MKWPERSTWAAGLAGIAAWGISAALTAYGIPIPAETLLPTVISIMTVVNHLVPDAAKVDADIKTIAGELPQTYSSPSDFPTGKNGQ